MVEFLIVKSSGSRWNVLENKGESWILGEAVSGSQEVKESEVPLGSSRGRF